MGICTVGLSMLATSIMWEINLARMDKSAKTIMEWSKKADLANEMLNDLYKVERLKESYENQGIGAKEEKEDEF